MKIDPVPNPLGGYVTTPLLIEDSAAYALISGATGATEPRPTLGDLPAGVQRIPIEGVLTDRHWPGEYGQTSYGQIRDAVGAAAADESVRHIVLDIDSPGGAVSLIETAAEAIEEAAAVKPVTALVRSNALSAAYWLASSASEIVAVPSGSVGSIGAVATHMSYEGMLGNMGLKATLVKAGAKKTLTSPYEQLSPEGEAYLQASVDAAYADFTGTVARNRGLSEEAVRGTEAAVYKASEGLDVGLVDRVMSLSEFLTSLSGTTEDTTMEITTVAELQTTYPDLVAAVVEQAASQDRGTDAAAVAAERQRIAAIVGCESADGRSQLAQHLAFNTDLPAEMAGSILDSAPRATSVSGSMPEETGTLSALMAQLGNPDVVAGQEAAASASTEEQELDDWITQVNGL